MRPLLLAALLAAPLSAQMFSLSPEQLAHYTPRNPFGRLPDGRPQVPDEWLQRLKALTVEDAWNVLREKGYPNQFVGGFQIARPGQKLVGRALTAQYLPARPDLAEVLAADARAQGRVSGINQLVIDRLTRNDVPVIDLMNTTPGHNFGGDNLHAAIAGATGTGVVIQGTIRDLEGMMELPHQIYYLKAIPAAVSGVTVIGVNIPIRIGNTLVMPGDAVLGDRAGVVFIPPQFVQEIVERGEAVHLKDEWVKQKLLSGQYKSSEVYGTGNPLSPELQKDLEEFIRRRKASGR